MSNPTARGCFDRIGSGQREPPALRRIYARGSRWPIIVRGPLGWIRCSNGLAFRHRPAAGTSRALHALHSYSVVSNGEPADFRNRLTETVRHNLAVRTG